MPNDKLKRLGNKCLDVALWLAYFLCLANFTLNLLIIVLGFAVLGLWQTMHTRGFWEIVVFSLGSLVLSFIFAKLYLARTAKSTS